MTTLTRNRDLAVACAAALLCAIVCLAVSVIPVRTVFAVPLALILPGYALMGAIFARVSLEVHSRLMLVPALSIAGLVIGALILNFMPGGLRPLSWALWLCAVVVVASGVAVWRRGPGLGGPGPLFPRLRVRPATLIVGLLAAGVAAAAMVASRIPLAAKNIHGYARLSMTPAGHDRAIVLSTLNGFEQTRAFTVVVTVDFNQVLSRTVRLAPGRSETVEVPLGASGKSRQVAATLTAAGSSTPLRSVNLSLPAA